MAASDRYVGSFFTPVDGNGNVLPGAKLYFYVSGTDTPQDTFADSDLTVPNENPVEAEGDGTFPAIVLGPAPYKVVLKRADDTLVWTVDPVLAASTAIDDATLALINAALAAAKAAAAAAVQALGAAESAKNEAAASAAAAAESAASIDVTDINARLAANETDIDGAEARLTVLETAFNSADKTYATKLLMDADTTQPDGTIATVLATGVQYIWDDTNTIWVEYPGDRYTQLEARVAELDTPTYLANMSDATEAVVIRSAISAGAEAAIAARMSTTFDGTTMVCARTAGANTSYNTFQGCLLKRVSDMAGKALTVTAEFTNEFEGSPGPSGIGFCLSPVTTGTVSSGHVVMGDAAYPAAGSVLFIVWRSNGVVQAFDGAIAGGGGSTVDIPGLSGTGYTYGQGDTISMVQRFSSDGSTATIYFMINGIMQGNIRLTTLPTGWFIGPVVRIAFGSVTDGTEYRVEVAQVDQLSEEKITFWLDPDAPDGGDGGRESRFNSVFDCSLRMLQRGTRFDLIFAPGNYRSGTLEFDSRDMHYLGCIAETGGSATIYGSTYLPAAPGNWTQHDAGTYPNVWSRDWLFAGKPPNTEAGAIIELDVPSNRGGVDVLPYKHPRRYTIGFAGTDAAAWAAVNNKPSSHYISIATGKIYFHPTGSGNPNSNNYELCDRNGGIALRGVLADLTASYDCEAYISGMTVKFCYGTNISLDRCRVYIENSSGEGSGALNGFSLNDCTGFMFNSDGIGNANDGLNHSSVWGPTVVVPRPGKILRINCKGNYNGWSEVAPFTDNRFYGDGTSNHTQAEFDEIGCEYLYNGKCGVVPAFGNYKGWNIRCVGNETANFQCGGTEPNVTQTVELYNVISEDSPSSFDLEMGVLATNASSRMIIRGADVRNCDTIFVVNAGSLAPSYGSIVAYDVRSQGHTAVQIVLGSTGTVSYPPAGTLITGP